MPALVGMSRASGTIMGGVEHLRQSIIDILTTPVGSRVMRPEYGSQVPRMVDMPVTKGWVSAVQAEVARALSRWEPRLDLSRVAVVAVSDGQVHMAVEGTYLGTSVFLEVTA